MNHIAICAVCLLVFGCVAPQKAPDPKPKNRPPPRRRLPPPEPAKPQPTKRELSQSEIHLTVTQHSPKVTECLKKHEDPGFYMMRLQVLSDGSVSRVTAIRMPTRRENPNAYANLPSDVDGGKDPGSPTSACLVQLLKQIRFPKFKGWPMDFQYPFVLRHD